MNVFKQIKEAVTARQAAEMYGLRVSRNGMVCCPFHNDRHPSMKVDKGFYCFACGVKGDVIHFVEKLFGISAFEAAKKLAVDFGVSIPSKTKKVLKKSQPQKKTEKNQYQIIKEFEQWKQYCFRTLADYLHLLERWSQQYAPGTMEEEWKKEFVEAFSKKEITEYYLDLLLTGTLEDQIAFIKDKGEEVKALAERLEEYKQRNNETNGISSWSDGKRLCG